MIGKSLANVFQNTKFKYKKHLYFSSRLFILGFFFFSFFTTCFFFIYLNFSL